MAKRLSDERIIQNQQLVRRLVEKNMESHRRDLVLKMLDGPVGEEFFTAPASTREEYHNCFPGGLCAHSLNVVNNLQKLAKALAPDRYSIEKILFVGLFHDLGKVGDGVNPYYLPNKNDWERKRGRLYEINEKCLQMPTSERGLFLLQRTEILLDSEEYLAIRLNDGQYAAENSQYKMKEPPLALLVHMADRWSVEEEKAKSRE